MDLIQGTLSVDEYATRFVYLSCFAGHLILDEEKKAIKFEHGLNRRIREHVHAHRIQEFSKLVYELQSLKKTYGKIWNFTTREKVSINNGFSKH